MSLSIYLDNSKEIYKDQKSAHALAHLRNNILTIHYIHIKQIIILAPVDVTCEVSTTSAAKY